MYLKAINKAAELSRVKEQLFKIVRYFVGERVRLCVAQHYTKGNMELDRINI